MQRIVITMNGSWIHEVEADDDIEVLLIDYNTAGVNEDEIIVPIVGEPACALRYQRTGNPDAVDSYYTNFHIPDEIEEEC